jgi:signal transduction histidine kinase
MISPGRAALLRKSRTTTMSGRNNSFRRWLGEAGLVRLRGTFAGLGLAVALLTFVIAATALKFTAYALPQQAPFANLTYYLRMSAALAAGLALPLPVLIAAGNLAPPSGVRRYAVLAVTTSLAVAAAVWSPLPNAVGGLLPFQTLQLGVFAALLAVVLEFRHRALATAGALLRVEIDALTADAQLRDASLRVLQAQIAPHFLFNTLANVRRLSQLDRRAAAAMLRDLVRYFSVTLERRDEANTLLGDEARLVDAYLRIHRVRMGKRLTYDVDVPAGLAAVPVPSMMLLTLVENAIKHGVNPLVEGGFIRLRARRDGDKIRLEVADNGQGLAVTEGHGTGLANVRARLAMLYGGRAALELEHGRPRGFVASIVLPE